MTQDWYRNFVQEGVADAQTAFGLLDAAHYLDVWSLVQLMSLRLTFVELADRSQHEVSTRGIIHCEDCRCSSSF